MNKHVFLKFQISFIHFFVFSPWCNMVFWLWKQICWYHNVLFVIRFADNTWNSRHCVELTELKTRNETSLTRNVSIAINVD